MKNITVRNVLPNLAAALDRAQRRYWHSVESHGDRPAPTAPRGRAIPRHRSRDVEVSRYCLDTPACIQVLGQGHP